MPRLTIDSRTYTNSDNKEHTREFLMYDGVEIERCYPASHENKIGASVSEAQIQECMPDVQVRDVMETMYRFSSYPSEEHAEQVDLITIVDEFEMYPVIEGGDLVLGLVVGFDWQNWNKPWSPSDFVEEMFAAASDFPEIDEVDYGPSDGSDYQAVVLFPLLDWDRLVLDELEAKWQATKRFVAAVERRMRQKGSENTLTLPFDFPEEVRTSCEQYLLYFVQFLKDVGIKANAQIQEQGDAGQVLFSVTPADGKQALERVRQALNAYLCLSQAPNLRPDFSASNEVQGLQRQIRYLNNELDFAEEKIRQKSVSLELQEMQIAQLKSGNLFEGSQRGKAEKPEERKIALFKGTVHLKRLDAKFADVDFPAIYDLLQKWLTVGYETEDLKTYFKRHGLRLFERSARSLPSTTDSPALLPPDNSTERSEL